jgi:hypothetical protein
VTVTLSCSGGGNVEVAWSYTSDPPICLHGVVLSWDNFTFLCSHSRKQEP